MPASKDKIKNLVIAWNRSAEYFALPIFEALLRNQDVGPDVRFLDIRGLDFEDSGGSVRIFDDEDEKQGNDENRPLKLERRIQMSEIDKIMPQSDVFYISVPNNPRAKTPERYISNDVMAFLRTNIEQGRSLDHDLEVYLAGLSTAWTKFFMNDIPHIVKQIIKDWSTVEPYKPNTWNAAKYAIENLLGKYLHRRGVISEKAESDMALEKIAELNPAALNEVQVFSQYGRSDRPNNLPGDEKKSKAKRKELCLSASEARRYALLYNVRRLITLVAHSDMQRQIYQARGIEFVNLSGLDMLLDKFYSEQAIHVDNMVVISPDEGGERDAQEFAEKLYHKARSLYHENRGYDGLVVVMKKERSAANEIKAMNIEKAFEYDPQKKEFVPIDMRRPDKRQEVIERMRGRYAAIVDDIIDTFGTMAKAIELISRDYQCKIFALGYHPVFSDPATYLLTKLFKEGNLLGAYVSKTIKHRDDRDIPDRRWIRIFDVAAILKAEIVKTYEYDRVNGLYVPRQEFLGNMAQ